MFRPVLTAWLLAFDTSVLTGCDGDDCASCVGVRHGASQCACLRRTRIKRYVTALIGKSTRVGQGGPSHFPGHRQHRGAHFSLLLGDLIRTEMNKLGQVERPSLRSSNSQHAPERPRQPRSGRKQAITIVAEYVFDAGDLDEIYRQ